jgi:hypothetical protein
VYHEDIIIIKKEKNEMQVKDEPYTRDHMLETCNPYADYGYVKTRRRRRSPIVKYGGNSQYFTKQV